MHILVVRGSTVEDRRPTVLTIAMVSCSYCMYRIWRHLMELVSSQQITIVITTHYIEEARQAHVVRIGCADIIL